MAQLLVTWATSEAGAGQAAQEARENCVQAMEHHGCQWLLADSSPLLHGNLVLHTVLHGMTFTSSF